MLDQASNSRLLVAISFHFVESRLSYLYSTIRELCLFPCEVEICIFTNVPYDHPFEDLKRLFPMNKIEIFVQTELAHPYELTWSHKDLIHSRFIGKDCGYSHFLYLEDDEQFSYGNLNYYMTYRSGLKKYGLLPGFARVEWSERNRRYCNVDNIIPQNLNARSCVKIDDITFTHLDNPYMGMYLLDKELISEYVKSKSFDVKKSAEVCVWEIRERAAMGLMFENVPSPFKARCVVGLVNTVILPQATIRHLPNNYADNPLTPFGKIPMAGLVRGEAEPSRMVGAP